MGAVLAASFAAALVGASAALGMRLGHGTPQAGPARTPGSTSVPSRVPLSNPGPVLFKVPMGGYSATRPAAIYFAGDGGNSVTRIHWASWGRTSAVGYGIVGLNNCSPSCAQGQVTYEDVTITLSDPIDNPRVWGRMTEAINGEPAEHWTYPKNWPLSASQEQT